MQKGSFLQGGGLFCFCSRLNTRLKRDASHILPYWGVFLISLNSGQPVSVLNFESRKVRVKK